MVNIDLPIALSIFLIFLITTVVFAVNYFANIPSFFKVRELRNKAEDLYDILFKTKGIPEDWEETGAIPAMPGVMMYLRKVPVLITETAGIARTNESIVVNITFDEDCINKTWNNTVRVYDSDLNAVAFNLTEQTFCSSQFLKTANVIFNVNISANEKKKFEIYFSDDQTIVASNDTVTYRTDSWVPSDGDSWTEATSDWSTYAGTGTVTLDTTNKKLGAASINITGTFGLQALGLEYNPTSSITGISNGWYLRAWLFIDSTASLNSINVSVSDGSNVITLDVLSEMASNSWYLFEKNISSAVWANWSNFNAANGIDFIRFFATNSTSGLTRTLKIDGLRFERVPLTTTVFPEETIKAISPSKTKGLRNVSSEEITTIGEGYKFRIEIEQK